MFDYVIEHSSIIIWRLSLKLAKIGKRHPKKKKKWNYLLRNICLKKKGRRLPNSPKWRPKRPITLRCEKMPKKARGEVLSLIILIRPRTFWSSHAALLFQNYQFFCTNLILELCTKTIPTCPYENWKKWVVQSYGSSPCLCTLFSFQYNNQSCF